MVESVEVPLDILVAALGRSVGQRARQHHKEFLLPPNALLRLRHRKALQEVVIRYVRQNLQMSFITRNYDIVTDRIRYYYRENFPFF